MTGKQVFDNLLSTALALSALIVAAVVIRREVLPRRATIHVTPIATGTARASASGGNVVRGSGPRVVEFGDYECRWCREAHRELLQIQKDVPVALVFRHLPLQSTHPHAYVAALAAECAAEQGAFPRYHDALMLDPNALSAGELLEVAKRVGLPDRERFDACLRERRYAKRVDADVATARALGVPGTPAFLIGDTLFAGLPLDEIRTHILAAVRGRDGSRPR